VSTHCRLMSIEEEGITGEDGVNCGFLGKRKELKEVKRVFVI
jgi:hypothetical protein